MRDIRPGRRADFRRAAGDARKLARTGTVDADDMRAVLSAGASREQNEDALAVGFAFNTTGRLANAFAFEVLDPGGFEAGAKYSSSGAIAEHQSACSASAVGSAAVVIRYLHVLAMATFVGGQLMLAACVVPALRSDRESLRAVARRFGWATLAALGVLVATGLWLARGRWDDGTLHVKLSLVVLVGVLIVWHLRQGAAHWLQGAIFLVSLAIVWLGLSLAH
jgi:hypothetical protein